MPVGAADDALERQAQRRLATEPERHGVPVDRSVRVAGCDAIPDPALRRIGGVPEDLVQGCRRDRAAWVVADLEAPSRLDYVAKALTLELHVIVLDERLDLAPGRVRPLGVRRHA